MVSSKDKADQAALAADVQRKANEAPLVPPFISEGVRQDILLHGKTTDPVSGRVLTRADLPE